MTLVCAHRFEDCVKILTSTGSYDSEGRVLSVDPDNISKVPGLPIVLSTSGDSGFLAHYYDKFLMPFYAGEEREGRTATVDATITFISESLRRMEESGCNFGDWRLLIGTWHDPQGPLLYAAMSRSFHADFIPYRLFEPKGGTWFTSTTPTLDGLKISPFSVTSSNYREFAEDFGEHQRAVLMPAYGSLVKPARVVGGSLKLATVSCEGASIETITDWPDVVGEKISVYRRSAA